MSRPRVWLDGRLLPADRARIDPSERGFLLGDGLFETLLALDGRVPLAERHLARLAASAAALGIPMPFSKDAIAAACRSLLRANGLAAGPAALRITLSAGPGPRGLARPEPPRPTLVIAAARRGAGPLPPARLHLASTRVSAASPLRRHKTLSYLENVLAWREAAAAGADEALLINTDGRIAEASAANLFVLRDGALWTPRIEDGALPGITRGLVLELAPAEGLAVREAGLRVEDLVAAEAVFLTSSLAGLRPVVSLGGLGEPGGGDGPMDRPDARWAEDRPELGRLQAAYARALGLAPGTRRADPVARRDPRTR